MTLSKKKNLDGYSISEVSKLMAKFTEESAERLRLRLRRAWKKQDSLNLKISLYHEVKV